MYQAAAASCLTALFPAALLPTSTQDASLQQLAPQAARLAMLALDGLALLAGLQFELEPLHLWKAAGLASLPVGWAPRQWMRQWMR